MHDYEWKRFEKACPGASLLFDFPLLYEGWECDSVGCVVKAPDGKRCLLLTNHGHPYVEVDGVEALTRQIQEYKEAITKTQNAIDILRGAEV